MKRLSFCSQVRFSARVLDSVIVKTKVSPSGSVTKSFKSIVSFQTPAPMYKVSSSLSSKGLSFTHSIETGIATSTDPPREFLAVKIKFVSPQAFFTEPSTKYFVVVFITGFSRLSSERTAKVSLPLSFSSVNQSCRSRIRICLVENSSFRFAKRLVIDGSESSINTGGCTIVRITAANSEVSPSALTVTYVNMSSSAASTDS